MSGGNTRVLHRPAVGAKFAIWFMIAHKLLTRICELACFGWSGFFAADAATFAQHGAT